MTTHCFINGVDVPASTTYVNIDPSTGKVLGDVARGSVVETSFAVASAREAQIGWAATSTVRRADALDNFSRLIRTHIDELSLLESEDTGKPISQARNDVNVCARYFQFYSRAIESFYGYQIPLDPQYQAVTTREPFGVIAHILAWNYPLQLFARAVAPAIATGNAVVVKPADETPRTAVRLAQLAVEAGIPAGVINVVTGIGTEAGAALSAQEGIDHIGFVGSTEVGKAIAAAAAQQLIPVILELGGKSPHIVFADADLDEVVPTAVRTIIQNAGQTCSAGSRLIVDRRVHEEVVSRIAAEMEKVRIGPGREDPDLGPLISQKQLARVENYVAGASGKVLTGGHAVVGEAGGFYYSPTLIDNVDPFSPIAQEEIFGPVLVAMPFDTTLEAIELANSTEYGLIAAVWTQNIDIAYRVSQGVHVGQVFVNNFGAGGGVELPFGGFKHSGYGREKGLEALFATTQTKTTIFKVGALGG
ncbi:aldehyde dehydrogenase family protein [Candidatus Aquiluna sp. UB-MaderosW2red]|uniref:aldehyde dehydrogenase family protein n=1 Tax=Candidatus Aquiluna sp. UB-MaderosW2red TaxID=1855377 RepID=UPI000875DCF7|nr:aldehyde dehydrogenase family protein [Candidatus Aquiluna sp. UB-MaderosW2red]SCX05246.1 aldehyde dehydrogenase (NAD+)/betaine-aldehyde dehydrogenase [Candidatus Aquiluna sp. UB-MaderosW2red]